MTTKKKWAIGIGVFLVLGFLGSVMDDGKGGKNSENKTESQQSVQPEQKQETKQQAREQKKVEKTEAKQETKQETKQEESFLGTYEVTDKVNCTIRITINDDETATVTGVRGENVTYYCSWHDFISSGGGIMLKFSDEMPLLVFEGGQDKDNAIWKRFFLKDGWLYSEYNNAKSKNPKWRLKATKIK